MGWAVPTLLLIQVSGTGTPAQASGRGGPRAAPGGIAGGAEQQPRAATYTSSITSSTN